MFNSTETLFVLGAAQPCDVFQEHTVRIKLQNLLQSESTVEIESGIAEAQRLLARGCSLASLIILVERLKDRAAFLDSRTKASTDIGPSYFARPDGSSMMTLSPKPKPPVIPVNQEAKVQGLGPAWTRGEKEAPAGEKDMGGWTAAVYTAEQQARLGVDEEGNKVEAAYGIGNRVLPNRHAPQPLGGEV